MRAIQQSKSNTMSQSFLVPHDMAGSSIYCHFEMERPSFVCSHNDSMSSRRYGPFSWTSFGIPKGASMKLLSKRGSIQFIKILNSSHPPSEMKSGRTDADHRRRLDGASWPWWWVRVGDWGRWYFDRADLGDDWGIGK